METTSKKSQTHESEAKQLFHLLFLMSYRLESLSDSNYKGEVQEIIDSIEELMSKLLDES